MHKLFNKKLVITTALDVLFTIILIVFLVFIRQQSIGYLNEVQSYSEELATLEGDLATQNLTSYSREEVNQTLEDVEKLLDKALLLIKVVLPLVLVILSLLFYYLIWYFISEVSIKQYLVYALIPAVLIIGFVYFVLNYIAYHYYFIESNPLLQLIITGILLIIVSYISLIGLIKSKSLRSTLLIAKDKMKLLTLPYLLIVISNVVYLILVFTLFFLTYVEAPLIIPGSLLLAVIVLINIQRMHFVNKLS